MPREKLPQEGATSGGGGASPPLAALVSWNLWGIPLFSERLHERAPLWRRHVANLLSAWSGGSGGHGRRGLVVACFQEAWGFRAGCGACCLHVAFHTPSCCRHHPSLGLTRSLRCCIRGRDVEATDCSCLGMLLSLLCGRWCCPCVLWDIKHFLLPPRERGLCWRGRAGEEEEAEGGTEEEAAAELVPDREPHVGRTLHHAVGLSGASMGTVAEQRCAGRLLDSGLLILASHPATQWGFLPFPFIPSGDERLARKGVLWAFWRGAQCSTLVLTSHLAASVPLSQRAEQLQIVADLAATLRDRFLDADAGPGAAPLEVLVAGDLNIQHYERELGILARVGLERVAAPGRTSLSGKVIDHVFCQLAPGREAVARGPVEQESLLSDHLPIGLTVRGV